MSNKTEEIEVRTVTSRTIKVQNESDYEAAARKVASSRIYNLRFDDEEEVVGIEVVDSDGEVHEIEF